MNVEDFKEKLVEFIDKHFGGSAKETPAEVVTKSLDDEQRLALFVVLEPDVVDLHGDTYDAQEVEKACHNFQAFCQKAYLFHKVETQSAEIVQNYIAPVDMTLDNGKEVKKGSWLQMWHFPEDDPNADAIWDAIKAGEINGVSIGALANVENLDE